MRLPPQLRSRRVQVLLALCVIAWVGWRGYRWRVSAPLAAVADSSWTEGTRILARDGRLLGERPSPEGLRGHSTRLDEVSERLVLATIASEDRRWLQHDGVDRFALLRAAWSYVRHGHIVSGGSTITQQLVKRLDHQGRPHPRTIAEKLREMARAQNLEAKLDKRALLEAYLNHIDYGHGWAGPEAAAQGYFGTRAAKPRPEGKAPEQDRDRDPLERDGVTRLQATTTCRCGERRRSSDQR